MKVDLGPGVAIETTPLEWAYFSQVTSIASEWMSGNISKEQAEKQLDFVVCFYSYIINKAAEEQTDESN